MKIGGNIKELINSIPKEEIELIKKRLDDLYPEKNIIALQKKDIDLNDRIQKLTKELNISKKEFFLELGFTKNTKPLHKKA